MRTLPKDRKRCARYTAVCKMKTTEYPMVQSRLINYVTITLLFYAKKKSEGLYSKPLTVFILGQGGREFWRAFTFFVNYLDNILI